MTSTWDGCAFGSRSASRPPRGGSGSRKTNQANTNAGSERRKKAARQESAATSPVIAKPTPAPTSSPARM